MAPCAEKCPRCRATLTSFRDHSWCEKSFGKPNSWIKLAEKFLPESFVNFGAILPRKMPACSTGEVCS